MQKIQAEDGTIIITKEHEREEPTENNQSNPSPQKEEEKTGIIVLYTPIYILYSF